MLGAEAMSERELIDPFQQELEASMDTKPSIANPYAPGTPAHRDWAEGHAVGEESWADLCAKEVAQGRPHPDRL
jgi:hypothetical protein